MKSGLWVLWQTKDGVYHPELIDKESSGFEHATYLADLDCDSQLEIYVAADEQQEVRQYLYRDGKFHRSRVVRIPDDHISWNFSSGLF